MLLLGIDFGTGGCKVTAIDARGALLGDASVEYTTYHEHPGWSEQAPADWYPAMCQALARLREKGVDLKDTAAVSFDGSTHNAVLMDGAMRPLRRAIMWTDQRSTAECAFLREHHRDLVFGRAYQMPAPTWTLPQMMWLKAHEPDVLAKTEHVLFVKDYVRFLVTDVAVTDRIEAQGTLFFDMPAQAWSEELVALSGLRMSALPSLVEPTDVVGRVTAAAACDMGVPEGIPVVCGTSDSAVEDYGAGAIEPGDLILKLATAGNVNVMTSAPHPDPRTLTYSHVIPGMWYTVSATNQAALCCRWMRDTFFKMESAAIPSPKGDFKPEGRFQAASGGGVYALMDAEAAASPIGANGVVFHPYLQGERSPYWDANLRASFTGVSISSTRGDFVRALFEGVAYSLRDCLGAIQAMGLPVKRAFLIGGGAKSELWSRIVCDVFNLPVAIPKPGDASFGAALLAGVGAGIFASSAEAVRQCLHIDRELVPDPVAAAEYDRDFARYLAIHDALAPIYDGTATPCIQKRERST